MGAGKAETEANGFLFLFQISINSMWEDMRLRNEWSWQRKAKLPKGTGEDKERRQKVSWQNLNCWRNPKGKNKHCRKLSQWRKGHKREGLLKCEAVRERYESTSCKLVNVKGREQKSKI